MMALVIAIQYNGRYECMLILCCLCTVVSHYNPIYCTCNCRLELYVVDIDGSHVEEVYAGGLSESEREWELKVDSDS